MVQSFAPLAEENIVAQVNECMPPALEEVQIIQSTVVEEAPTFNPIDQNKKEDDFRNYTNGPRQKKVEGFYRLNHTFQTFDHVNNLRKEVLKFDKLKMTVWDAFQLLDTIIDESDPDTNLTQLAHGLQTAEAIREEFPNDDWFQMAGLIHDLGKVLCAPCFQLPQWAIVGDTFPLGCKFSEKNVFPEFFQNNPDYHHPIYSTENGIYEPGVGIMNVTMSFGHDEYLYQVLAHNNCKLPLAALYMLRFHSFYAWHKQDAYAHLTNEEDRENFKWVKLFNRFDLYSKSHRAPRMDDVIEEKGMTIRDYYQRLVEKFLPGKLEW